MLRWNICYIWPILLVIGCDSLQERPHLERQGSLVIQLDAQDDDKLLQLLRYGQTEDSRAASRELIKRGDSVRGRLEATARDSDQLFGGRISHILEVIETNHRAQRSYFPLAKGFRWTYSCKSGASLERVLQVTEPRKIPVRYFDVSEERRKVTDVELQAWGLEGYDESPAYATETPDGIDILAARPTGWSNEKTIIAIGQFRWTTQRVWSFYAIHGCIGQTIQATLGSREKIQVSCGTFDCLKLANVDDVHSTIWLAQGIGIVRREVDHENKGGAGKTSEIWELASFSTQLSE
jgi:hypothetical protein